MTSHLFACWIVTLLLVCSTTSLNFLPEEQVKLINKVQKLETCPEYTELSHDFKDLSVEMDPETETLYVSGTLNATDPLEEGTTGLLKIFRCVTDDEKSCTKTFEIEIDDFCTHLPEKGKAWSQIVGSLQNFDPHCPVQPGVYRLVDAPLETKNLKDKYALVGHWQMMVMIQNGGRMMACLRCDVIISVDNARGRARR